MALDIMSLTVSQNRAYEMAENKYISARRRYVAISLRLDHEIASVCDRLAESHTFNPKLVPEPQTIVTTTKHSHNHKPQPRLQPQTTELLWSQKPMFFKYTKELKGQNKVLL